MNTTRTIRRVRAFTTRGGGADYHDQAPATGSTTTSRRRWRATPNTARAASASASTCSARSSSRSRPTTAPSASRSPPAASSAPASSRSTSPASSRAPPVTDIEKIWDQMYLSTLYYGRKGWSSTPSAASTSRCGTCSASSARSRSTTLLGGAVRDELAFYATGARPDLAKKTGLHRRQDAAAPRPRRGRGGPAPQHRAAPRHARAGRRRLLADARLLDVARPRLRHPAGAQGVASTG